MEYLYTGLTVIMTTPASLSFSSVTPNTNTANALTSYLVSLTFSQTHYSGDSILVTIPSGISLNSGFTCTTSTSGITVSCVQTSASVLKAVITGTVGSSIALTVATMKNNWYGGSYNFDIKMATNDTSNTYYT